MLASRALLFVPRSARASLRRVRAATVVASAPVESSPLDALGSAAPTWAALNASLVTAVASSLGRSDAGRLSARCLAASRLTADTALDVMDDPELMLIYSGAFDGVLDVCVALCDAHLRLLADCLLTGEAAATSRGYAALDALPPMLRRQHTAGAAAVGAAALLQLREDAELLRTMLALADEGEVADAEEARREGAAAAALCVAVDAVIGAMPQPDGE